MIRSVIKKIPISRSLFMQLLFVTLAFGLLVFSSCIFVNNMLANYLKRDADSMLTQAQIRILDELREAESLMISISKDVRDILTAGGGRGDVQTYFDEISADLRLKRAGFVFDGLHGYFFRFDEGDRYIPAPGWDVPDDFNALERPWYIAAMNAGDKIITTPMYKSLRTGQFQINTARLIFDNNDEPLGVVTMNVLLDNILRFAAETRLTENGYGFLANENFELVAHPEADFIAKHMREISPGFAQIVDDMENGEDFTRLESTNYQGMDVVFYCRQIDNGWYVGVATPVGEYYRDLTVLLLFLSILGLGLMSAVYVILIRIDAAKNKADKAFQEQNLQLMLMEKAREADELTQLIFDAMPFPVIVFNEDLQGVASNEESANLFGLSDKWEYIDKFYDLSPERQPDGEFSSKKTNNYLRIAFDEGYCRYEWMHQRINGEPIPTEITLVRVKFRDEYVVLGFARDLREEKAAVAAMREAEERTQLMLDTSPLGVVFLAEDFTILDCNQETLNMFKMPDDTPIAGSNSSVLSPEYQPNGELSSELRHRYLTSAMQEGYYRFEWEHKTFTGESFPCETTFVRSYYKGKNCVIAHVRDLRELKAMIARILEVGEYTQLLLDATPICCTLWDRNITIVNCNKEALHFFGVKDIGELNARFWDLHAEYQPDGTRSAEISDSWIRKTFDEGYMRTEWTHLTSSGEQLPCEITLTRVRYGNDYLVAAYTRDLREHKAYLAEINRARDAAEAANSAKTVFLANMSHEIRTPMNSVIGFSELAKDDDIPARTRDYLDNIEESAKWLLQIINDVLDISKIEAGRMELDSIPFDLHDVFSHCQTAIMPKAVEKGIMLYCYAEPSIGKKLLGDPIRLRQVIINLLSNAVKFTNSGIVKLLASIKEADSEHVTVHFEVKDSGIGMKPEKIATIFEPFIQADESISRKYGGTGLGLAITKNFIELMGGTLEVCSTFGVGSKFSFEVSFGVVSVPVPEPASVVFGDVKKPMFKGEVLICEDNYMNQQVVCDHLEKVGLKTVIANDGREGVDIVASRAKNGEKPFDLIFMDIHMPVMDGLEAAAKISALGVETPIVALTANILINDLKLYTQSGMSGHLGKPFTSQELWRCLLKHLSAERLSDVDERGQTAEEDSLQKRLTLTFVKNNQNTFAEFKKAIGGGDIKLAHRLAHSLKSNAGQIGEKNLQKAAAVAESMLQNGENKLTQTQSDILEAELKTVLEKLAPMLVKAEAEASAVTLSDGEARELLRRLEPMLKNRNPECMHLLDELRAVPGTEKLARGVEEFRFKQALAELAEIKNRMGIT